ncbi:hypothetical protein KCU71_g130, partial [Aureobasidium melanogenum]
MSSPSTRSVTSLLSMLKKRLSGLSAVILILYPLEGPFIKGEMAERPSNLQGDIKRVELPEEKIRSGIVRRHDRGSVVLTPQHQERSPRALNDASRRAMSGMTSRQNHRQQSQPETRVIWANMYKIDLKSRGQSGKNFDDGSDHTGEVGRQDTCTKSSRLIFRTYRSQ